MKRFKLSCFFIVIFGIAFALIYFVGTDLDVAYAQDLSCEQQRTEAFDHPVQTQFDSDQREANPDEDLEKKWRDAMLASILDDLFWLFVIASVGAVLDVITGSPW
jgi:hypothetical protein